jgi:hypothetical protein
VRRIGRRILGAASVKPWDVMPFREHDLDGVPLALVGVVALEVLADEPCLRPNDTIRPGIEAGTSLEDVDANRVFLEHLAGMVERTGDDILEKARTFRAVRNSPLSRTRARAQASNLLVPVCFSATHVAYSTLRTEPQYMIIGQAAGVAATMAIDKDVAVQDIDTQALTARLRARGAIMEWSAPVSR